MASRSARLLAVLAALTAANVRACPANPETKELCSHRGYCNMMTCDCWAGFEGPSCEFRICPSGAAWSDMAVATDVAHQTAACSARGECDRTTGVCTCLAGFEGVACERMTCPGTTKCSGHGRCVSQQRLGEEKYGMAYNGWDADMIYGCICDEGYHGYDCALRDCPTGDDMLTRNQENEIQFIRCNIENAAERRTGFYISFRGIWTRRIQWDDSAQQVKAKIEEMSSIDDVSVAFLNTVQKVNDEAIACAYPQIIRIEFLKQYGDLPALQVVSADPGPLVTVACNTDNIWWACDYNSFASESIFDYTVVSATGIPEPVDGESHSTGIALAVKGTREEEVCAGRGFCDEMLGTCTCYTPFESSNGSGDSEGTRGECGYRSPNSQVFMCPGDVSCMGHGVCSGSSEYVCSCVQGFTGAACTNRVCPMGKAWFGAPKADNDAHELTECSNKGSCSRETGKCTCDPWFEGTACELLKCAISTEQEELGLCSGHGDCLTQGQLAYYTTENGDSTSYTYGATPSDEMRWDYDAVQGCKCDEGYEGIDCSKRSCPTGDDNNTWGKPEIQSVTCVTGFMGGNDGTRCYDTHPNRVMWLETDVNYKVDQTPQESWAAANRQCSANGNCGGVQKVVTVATKYYPTAAQEFEYWLVKPRPRAEWRNAVNPGTVLYHRVNCEFRLEFRQQFTEPLPYFASASDVKAALEALPNIRLVEVNIDTASTSTSIPSPVTGPKWAGDGDNLEHRPTTSSDTHVCPTGSNEAAYTTITFTESPGDIPPLIFHGPNFGMSSSLDRASACTRAADKIEDMIADSSVDAPSDTDSYIGHCGPTCARSASSLAVTSNLPCDLIDVRLEQGECIPDNGCKYTAGIAESNTPATCEDACAAAEVPAGEDGPTIVTCLEAGYGCVHHDGIENPSGANCLAKYGCEMDGGVCRDECAALIYSDRQSQCVSDSGSGCTLTMREPVLYGANGIINTVRDSTYEDVECSNHGTCDYTTGQCVCYTGYGGSDGWGASGVVPDCGYRLPNLQPSEDEEEEA